jgi:uncharacterized protein
MKHHQAVITTYSGTHVDLLQPEYADIVIDDIAYSLSKTMRFNGHTNRPYSVAEHSLHGLPFCRAENRLEFLLHDAPEAYLGDIVGPLKGTGLFASYCHLESRWWGAISARFGVRLVLPKEIHTVDKRMLITEQRDLMGRRPRWNDRYQPLATHLSPVMPSCDEVAERFLAKFHQLTSKTVGAKR